jgi:hypothetical protein
MLKFAQNGGVNIVCSGTKTKESELQNFDPEKIIPKMRLLMEELPITACFFSPAIGVAQCFGATKKETYSFHDKETYKGLVNKFKKPDYGMMVVIKDFSQILFENIELSSKDFVVIGDMKADEDAAIKADIDFIHADDIHNLRYGNE